jgi:hypothetical protein
LFQITKLCMLIFNINLKNSIKTSSNIFFPLHKNNLRLSFDYIFLFLGQRLPNLFTHFVALLSLCIQHCELWYSSLPCETNCILRFTRKHSLFERTWHLYLYFVWDVTYHIFNDDIIRGLVPIFLFVKNIPWLKASRTSCLVLSVFHL